MAHRKTRICETYTGNPVKVFLIPSLAAAGFSAPADSAVEVSLKNANDSSTSTSDTDFRRYLNRKLPFTLAGHSSHSSHGSHGSHRSSSTGGHSSHASHQSSSTPTPTPSNPSRNKGSTPPTSILPLNPQNTPQLKGGTNAFALVTLRVQLALYAYGYYSGAIDGLLGSETQTAIIRYQRDHGLSTTGTLSDELIKSLNIPTD